MVRRVYDGDTCNIVFDLQGTFIKFRCRLYGIDTPEMKPRKNVKNRENMIELAHKAKDELTRLCLNKVVTIECFRFDKYGRLLVRLIDGNVCINDLMIENNYGKSYFGGKKE